MGVWRFGPIVIAEEVNNPLRQFNTLHLVLQQLASLCIERADLTLIHWPAYRDAPRSISRSSTWRATPRAGA